MSDIDLLGPPPRKPGEFARTATGAPQVADPSGAIVGSGPRKDLPRLVTYRRPSSLGRIFYDAGTFGGNTQAADRGTHLHRCVEVALAGGRPTPELLAAGEALGIPADVQRLVVRHVLSALRGWGLEVLHSEVNIVNDTLRAAGTADLVCRTTKPLGPVPAGVVVVVDLKTGTRYDDAPSWWVGYPVQMLAYAGGVPYDVDTGTRGAWGHDAPSTEHALIVQVDLPTMLADGDTTPQLVYVPLAVAHRQIAMIDAVTDLATEVLASFAPIAAEVAPDVAPPGDVAAPAVSDDDPAAGDPQPARRVVDLARDESHAVRRDELEVVASRTPDDGDEVGEAAFEAVRNVYKRLDAAAVAWISSLTGESQRAGCSFHAKDAYTARRLHIITGLVRLAANGADDAETVRTLVASAVDNDEWAHFASVPVGAVVGAMHADEAERFADLCARLVAGEVAATFDESGVCRLVGLGEAA